METKEVKDPTLVCISDIDCMFVYISDYVHVFVHVCLCVSMCACVYVCVYVHVCVCVRIHACMWVYVPTYKCACCIFVHLHLEIILSVILVSSQSLTEDEEDTLLFLVLEEYEKQGLHGMHSLLLSAYRVICPWISLLLSTGLFFAKLSQIRMMEEVGDIGCIKAY